MRSGPHSTRCSANATSFGAGLAFQTYTDASGGTFPFLRFYIAAIPFVATMAMLAVPEGTLNDPSLYGVRYLLAVPRTDRGLSDALNQRYPTLYETGADVATLELEIPNDGDSQPDWRLYRVNEPAEPRA